MLQRVQTVWLLCGALSMAAMAFMPMLKDSAGGLYDFMGRSQPARSGLNNYVVHLVVLASALVFAAAVFLFRNRPLQMRLVRFNFLLVAGSIALGAFYLNNVQQVCGTALTVNPGAGFFLPVPALLFNWLAARGIRADERRVRDLNRIR